jgi:hypothetical protein
MDIKRFHPKRVFPGIKRRIIEKKFLYLWNSTAISKKNKVYISSLQDKHRGERLFLIANGPSIKDMNLSCLKNEYTMCMNRFYIYFDKLGFIPNFLLCVEDLVLGQFADDFNNLPIENKFVNWRLHKKIDKCHYLKEDFSFHPFFQTDLTKPTHFSGTVTFACLQLAYYLGFTEIVIIGMDHSFKEKGIANKVEVRTYEKDESHFDPNYFPKGMKWKLPDLDKSEIGYQIARDFYEKNGRKIVDATINGKCTIFPKTEFSSYIKPE